ncbi:MAG: hypothetical protein Q9163_006205 [Psora crenata]
MASDSTFNADPLSQPGNNYNNNPVALPRYAFLLLFLFLYPLFANLLRHRRIHTILDQYPYKRRVRGTPPSSSTKSNMTLNTAFLIQLNLAELEFPFTFEKALQFALFRTYGIPSISRLLVATKQFTEEATKRYADTTVLVAEITGRDPQHPRTIEAIARMNYIHSAYQKAGKISNHDMLYTLSLFALEPYRWIERYEWRKLEDVEKCALGTFWKAIGDAMAIDFGPLKSGGGGGAKGDGGAGECEGESGWADGLQWLEEVEEWAEEYERKTMLPHKNNWKTAEQTTAVLLWHVPSWAKPYGKRVVCALMDERLRTAML